MYTSNTVKWIYISNDVDIEDFLQSVNTNLFLTVKKSMTINSPKCNNLILLNLVYLSEFEEK